MTSISNIESTDDRMVQICRERSARGVATRADWERLAETNPDIAYRELRNFLQLNENAAAPDPYSTRNPHMGLAIGFVVGVVVMAVWWLIADYLNREVVTSGKQWDLVTFTQYFAASMLPVFAWIGWRYDQKRKLNVTDESSSKTSLINATWPELLERFDATRKAGGTRMY